MLSMVHLVVGGVGHRSGTSLTRDVVARALGRAVIAMAGVMLALA